MMEIDSIRIRPSEIVFYNPSDGHEFEALLTLQNVGGEPVHLGTLPPSDPEVKVKQHPYSLLVPGMRIVKKIKYTVAKQTPLESCTLPIVINSKTYDYKIRTAYNEALLQINTDFIDFGMSDLGTAPIIRKMHLMNPSSTMPVKFLFDFGENRLNIIAEPNRGTVPVNTTVEITLRASLMTATTIETEFYVLTVDRAIRIGVRATAKIGQMLIEHEYSMRTFTLLRFPTTYFGSSTSQMVLLRNDSYTPTFFYIQAQLGARLMEVREARLEDEDYDSFRITTLEGYLPANDVRLLHFTFRPRVTQAKTLHNINHYLIMLRLNKLNVQNVSEDMKSEELYNNNTSREDFSMLDMDEVEQDAMLSTLDDDLLLQQRSEEQQYMSLIFDNQRRIDDDYIKLIIYGDAERASISIRPNQLILGDVALHCDYTRILQLTNESSELPIIVRYSKIAFIDVFPPIKRMQPRETIEVLVVVNMKAYTTVNGRLNFDLFYCNTPAMSKRLVKVGRVGVALALNAKVVARSLAPLYMRARAFPFAKPNIRPKRHRLLDLLQCDAVLALPNDRPTTLRRWNSKIVCKTIYAGIKRVCRHRSGFERNTAELIAYKQNQERYRLKHHYGKRLKSVKRLSYYDLSRSKIAPKCAVKMNDALIMGQKATTQCIPLTPQQLAKVIISPQRAYANKKAPHSKFVNVLRIENRNDVPICACFRSHRAFDFVLDDAVVELGPNETGEVKCVCVTREVGLYHYGLDVIVNNSHIFETSISLMVEPKKLVISTHRLVCETNVACKNTINLSNELNAPIDFVWMTPAEFEVKPMKGRIAAGRTLSCLIIKKIEIIKPGTYELALNIDECRNEIIFIDVRRSEEKLLVTRYIDFGTIPAGIILTKNILLQNQTAGTVRFYSDAKFLIDGIHVTSGEGILQPYSMNIVKLNAEFDYESEFVSRMWIKTSQHTVFTIDVAGATVLPQMSMQPERIVFNKIPVQACVYRTLRIRNDGEVDAVIEFGHEDDYLQISHRNMRLKPGEERGFNVAFMPHNVAALTQMPALTINGVKLPNYEKLVATKLRLMATEGRLMVKRWRYDFDYFPYYDYPCIDHHLIEFENVWPATIEMCIRLDELYDVEGICFQHCGGGCVNHFECSIVIELAPKEVVRFLIFYKPERPSTWRIALPVYVRDCMDEAPYNSLEITATYPSPTIDLPNDRTLVTHCVNFGAIPFDFRLHRLVALRLRYHRPNCTISLNYEPLDVLRVETLPYVLNVDCTLDVKFELFGMRECSFDKQVVVACSCGAHIRLQCVGIITNAFLLNYYCVRYFQLSSEQSLILPTSVTRGSLSAGSGTNDVKPIDSYLYAGSYPVFPNDDDYFFNVYMYSIVRVVEQWICDELTFGRRYYHIPDMIALCQVAQVDGEIRLKIPLHGILKDLIGRLNIDLKCESEEKVPLTLYSFYETVITILTDYGANLICLSPEYLLSYSHYGQLFKGGKRLSEKQHYLCSKQAWIDLFLQIFDVFHYKRLLDKLQFIEEEIKVQMDQNLYSMQEIQLQCHLLRHYEAQKALLASKELGNGSDESLPTMEKIITNLSSDFSDSLMLIALVLDYCPFLQRHFYGVYAPPSNTAELIHNANLLIKALQLLNLSFTITAFDIIYANNMKILFFITYLYNYLLQISEHDVLRFKANLAKKFMRVLKITNDNESAMQYRALLFNNDRSIFSISSEFLEIQSGGTCELIIHYKARFMGEHRAVLLLSGEICGGKYSAPKLFELHGVSVCMRPSQVIHLNAKQYETSNYNLTVQAPGDEEGVYDMFYTMRDPKEHTLHLRPINECRLTVFKFFHHHLIIDANGNGYLQVRVYSIMPQQSNIWIYFTHETLGDFYVLLIVRAVRCNVPHSIVVDVSEQIFSRECTCGIDQVTCARNVSVEINARHMEMWGAFFEMVLDECDEQEAEFWREQRDTEMGLNVIKRLLSDREEFSQSTALAYLFRNSYQYNVTLSTSSVSLLGDSLVTIANAFKQNAKHSIILHFDERVDEFTMKLSSVDEKQIRLYHISVNCFKHESTNMTTNVAN